MHEQSALFGWDDNIHLVVSPLGGPLEGTSFPLKICSLNFPWKDSPSREIGDNPHDYGNPYLSESGRKVACCTQLPAKGLEDRGALNAKISTWA